MKVHKRIARSIKNVGTEKSLYYYGNQHHSEKYVKKVEPIMAETIQNRLTETLKTMKPSTNVCFFFCV